MWFSHRAMCPRMANSTSVDTDQTAPGQSDLRLLQDSLIWIYTVSTELSFQTFRIINI